MFRNRINWVGKMWQIELECQTIAAQNRVARNEDKTPGATLFHLSGLCYIPIGNTQATLSLALKNIFNRKYYNHLSFYRKIEIPEPGRNFQISLNIPFTLKNN